MQSPDRVLGRIYSEFGYPESDAVESILRDAAHAARTHTSNHVYNLEAMGLTREQIVREFSRIFDRFDFDGQRLETEESRVEIEIAS